MQPQDTNNNSRKDSLTRSATYASLSVALILVSAKVWAWYSTSSVAVLSSLVDSALDVIASAITFFAVWYALSPADSEHRFGHGKSEGLAAFFQSLVIAGSALFVCYEAIQRFLDPRPLQDIGTGVFVMIGSIALTFVLLAYQRYVVKKTGSVAISADALHYKTDLLVNLSVAIALPLSVYTGLTVIDPIVGVCIAGYIMWSTWEIAAKSLQILLDEEINIEDRKRIQKIAEQHSAVLGFHDMRTRSAGSTLFIQFHLELAPDTSLFNTHTIMDEVEDAIREQYPRCEIIIHADPLGFPEKRDHFD